MKMKRYIAADMRAALHAVRDEQGPDAVILGTRTVPQGVEIFAAVDLELAAAPGSLEETAALKRLEQEALQEPEAPPALSARSGDMPAAPPLAEPAVAAVEAASVGEELRCLRALLEQQLAALAWNDFTRREPFRARALTELARLGLDAQLAMQIAAELAPGLSAEQQQRMPYALLARRLHTCDPLLPRRGGLLLIGPPGAGKTTMLAKLAARYVLEEDPANLLILSTDEERLGSFEQLACLGRLLGVRVEGVIGAEALCTRLAALPDRCILIDSPGAGARDVAAAGRYRELLERCPGLAALLVLPASAQAGVVQDAVSLFGDRLCGSCALTRLDEAVSLGGVLSALARSQLPVAYVSEGPRIPEDLRPARSHQLVARAVELARIAGSRADDELLARRYGGGLHAAA